MAKPKLSTLSIATGLVASLASLPAQSWTKLSPASSPTPRKGSGMVYDSFRDRIVMHGMPAATATAETWEWDRVTWTQRTLAIQPAAREFAALAYDSQRKRVVLFGGTLGGLTDPPNPAMLARDTWEYDGLKWQQLFPAASPSARTQAQMAYDARRGRCVLFGGGVAAGVAADTWEWDGQKWTQVPTATGPSARQSAPLAYDSIRGVTVMFGGLGQGGTYLGGPTWEFDGVVWRQFNPTISVPLSEDHGFAYDAARRRVVMTHGWSDPQMSRDTWEYDGAAWAKTTPANAPSGRMWPGFCYDPVARHCVLFGGLVFGTSTHHGDTWTYAGPSPAVTAFPSGQIASEGAQHSSAPFAVSGSRLQSILMARGFTGATRGTIRGLDLRANQDTKVFPARTLALTVSLAFAAKTPQNAHPVFDNNFLPGTKQTVLSATGMNLPSQQPTLVGPAPFAIALPFTTPFVWNGQDLVLEFGSANNSGLGNYEIDAAVQMVSAGAADTFGTSCSGAIGVPGPVQTLWERKQLVPGGALISTVTGAAPYSLAVMIVGSSTTQWAGVPLPYQLGPCFVYTGLDLTGLAATDAVGKTVMVWDLPLGLGGSAYAQWAIVSQGSSIGLALTNPWKFTLGPGQVASYDTLEATTASAVYGMKWPDRYLVPVLQLRL